MLLASRSMSLYAVSEVVLAVMQRSEPQVFASRPHLGAYVCPFIADIRLYMSGHDWTHD